MKVNNDIICIIMALNRSSRTPGKNLADIHGKSVAARAIDTVLDAQLFDHVILSSDHPELLGIAREAGIDIINRDPALCGSTSCLANAFRDNVEQSIAMYGKLHRWGCLFMPTHFLVSAEFLHRQYRIISNVSDDNPRASDQPVSAINYGGDSGLFPWFYDLRPGVVACRPKVLDYHKTKDVLSVDIDRPEDLERARLIYKWREERHGSTEND